MYFDYITENLLNLKAKVSEVCVKAGRNPDEIGIVAVSKTFPHEAIKAAFESGQADIGENRVQELTGKYEVLRDIPVKWHLVGHLQSNKVKYIAPFIYLIHSLDSIKLAYVIEKEAEKNNRTIDCLIQVNTSHEEQKSGCEPDEVLSIAQAVSGLAHVRLKGLMTIAKIILDEASEEERKIVRDNYRTLRNIFEELKSLGLPNTEMKYLSMGMTADFDIAIEEGSNMIRIGTAVFGRRN
jgi:hypothetical protein